MKFNTVHTFLFIMLVVAMFGFEAAFAQIELGGK